ncbi:DUF3822 domain-containing protein [Flagellimonas aquimarina]|uniref:DUF3822 domain-containing protein n=1 Tax=Flagellimonas aquimarina TaxID=2201895 RepID=A0A316LBY7_9FLAO|nr:DUF3822 family protein [Allomuricauda koreensis]PWL37590.1 DUF3822 domain-containing protein [Allomuricauda koreensis]
MTGKKRIKIEDSKSNNTIKKLSIQVGLNGLSFCVLDTISNEILVFEKTVFKTSSTPYLVLKELKTALSQKNITDSDFSEVMVIHKNGFFGLVPKTLFNEEELPNYLKFNAKIMANDHIVFDEILNQDMVNVYVPFTNVNNYIFDLFGEFEFKHSGTILIGTLLSQSSASREPICYVQVSEKEMEVVVISEKKLLLYNLFEYKTKEDFLYYLLFSLEQLQLNLEHLQLKLFGLIEEGDAIYELCYRYIKHVSVFAPSNSILPMDQLKDKSIDFTVLSSL